MISHSQSATHLHSADPLPVPGITTRLWHQWRSRFQITKDGDKPKYVLDATKDRLLQAPKVEGDNYDRLYARETAEPAYVYWHVIWLD